MLPSAAVLLAAAVACTAATPRKWALPADPALLAASADDPSYRLPSDLLPLHYDLRLRPNLAGDFQFHGSVAVALRVLAATPNVTLHAEDLEVEGDSVSVTTSGAEGQGEEVEVTTRSRDEDRSFYTVTLDSPLKVGGEYTLRMNYTGHHRDSMRGFYRSSYLDQDNNTAWLATTHFEPTAARRAFPCFDEPALKATFRVSIAAPPGLRAISNTPVARLQPEKESGRTWYHFEQTPMPMSTYLVAFVVSAFDNTTSADGFASVWLQPGLESQGRFSAEFGPEVIRAMENFTQVPYFLPKMDEVSVPDFSAGAMENYGIVTFRERLLLFEEGESSTSDKQQTATVVAHEFGHQWFGDLVGPRWWTYIWLNEGFATYFQYFGAAMVEPDWRLDEQFVVEEVHSSLAADSYESHPMTFPSLGSPSQISAAFDTISYGKAGSVIRMIEHVMTHETFRNGLTNYLIANANSTARDQDLFDSLVEEYDKDFTNSSVDLQDFLDSWARQAGFPVLTVTRNYSDGTVKVSQERFRRGAQVTSNQTWWVPLTYATKSHPDFNSTSAVDWLTRNDSEKVLEGLTVADGDWVIFNVHQTGFYRVSYDEANWRLLARQLDSDQFKVIPAVNRAQILNDAFTLAEEGRLDYGLVVGLLRYLPRETDYIPWAAAMKGLTTLNDKVKMSPDYSVFQEFALGLIKPSYDKLGFNVKSTDDHTTKLLRSLILQKACYLGHPSCLETAVSKFSAFLNDPEKNKVEPDVRRTVYCYGLQAGSYDDYAALWRRYLTTKVATEKVLLLDVLGCTGDEKASHEYIMKSLNNHTGIRDQDASYVTTSIFSSSKGIEYYITFLEKYFDEITSLENDTKTALEMVEMVSNYIWTQEQYNKLEKVLEDHKEEMNLTGDVNRYLVLARSNFASARILGEQLKRAVKQTYRLPTSLSPLSYRVKVRPHLSEGNFTFDGEVEVRVRADEATDRVVLHASDLELEESSAVVRAAGNSSWTIAVREQWSDGARQIHTLVLDGTLEAGREYDVRLAYLGHLRDDMNGFYRSYYLANGTKRWLASTQFESTGARRAFPCFDEPAMKARITLSIERPSNYTAVSNMELVNTTAVEDEEDLYRDTFAQTPPMSTYLLAFIVSDFERSSDPGHNVSVLHRPGAQEQVLYALNVSRPLLEFMEEFTGIPFPLPKMDEAAIPDFSAGAMENWGLVTYRDRDILFDEQASTTADRQNVATTIAHEFSHQWFGDLVSPAWWTYTWLNEGFASYFELFAAAGVQRSWRLEEQFATLKLQPSLASDAYVATRAITSEVYTPDEIESVFDYVSYGKAGSVIRMMSHFLTEEVFQKGLSLYLNERSYKDGRPDYLFSALQRAAHEAGLALNVSSVMDTWTLQEGHPLLTVKRDRADGSVTVEQKRFLMVKDNNTSRSEEKLWWIPLTYTKKYSSNFYNTSNTIWFNGPTMKINDSVKSDEWIIFNLQQTGFYRVNYDEVNWQLLAAQLDSDQLQAVHAVNRAQLVDDSLNLARAGELDYGSALTLASYLRREEDYIPWSSAFTALGYLDARLAGMSQHHYDLFKDFVLYLLSNLYSKLGFEPRAEDDHVTKMLRAEVVSWACKLEMPECVMQARDMFSKKMANPASVVVPADVASAVFCTGVRHGGPEDWRLLKALHDDSAAASEQGAMLSALGCSANQSLIAEYLMLSITEDSGIRKQDAASVFSAVYANHQGVDTAFKFLTDNFQQISEYYGSMGSIGKILTGIANKLSTQTQLDKLKEFVASKKSQLGRALTASQQAVETSEGNVRWLQQRGPAVEGWLKRWKSQHSGGGSGAATTPSASSSASTAAASLLLLAAASARLLL
ncbi:uncharacterized protein LOC134535043 [Bacillus rossius redtenbacheri]|uniref:uncharacterized protein LOC134535043 n=1 Tax=Bacillus rossius redtenbacheri TaxID=93214 RepID=UPI002FDE0565